jgi:hypothetical protein
MQYAVARLRSILRKAAPVLAADAGLAADALVFKTLPKWDTLSVDLEKAGIAKKDATGRVVHFHSFRKTFQTLGANSGMGQRAAQEMLGHSDANLTANTYTDIPALELHREIAKLPWVGAIAVRSPQEEKASVRPAIANRFKALCLELLSLSEAPDLQGEAFNINALKVVEVPGFEPSGIELDQVTPQRLREAAQWAAIAIRSLSGVKGAQE